MMPLRQAVEQRPYGELVVDDDDERECLWLHLTIPQAECLLTGYLPTGVKGVLYDLLHYRLQDEKRAARPIQKARKNDR